MGRRKGYTGTSTPDLRRLGLPAVLLLLILGPGVVFDLLRLLRSAERVVLLGGLLAPGGLSSSRARVGGEGEGPLAREKHPSLGEGPGDFLELDGLDDRRRAPASPQSPLPQPAVVDTGETDAGARSDRGSQGRSQGRGGGRQGLQWCSV